MKFLLGCLKGIAIGSGAILPGISSGVFCVIFGIYEKLLDSILNFFSDTKNNLKFLFPIILGVGIGIVLFGNLLNYCLFQFPIQTKSIFIGLILGSIPSLLKQVNSKHSSKPFYWLFFLLALFIGIACIFLENTLAIQTLENVNFIYLVMCGFFMSVGIVVPGVSSTIILMLLGVYSIYLSSVSTLYFPILIPISIGVIIGGFLFMKLTKFLLEHFYAPTFYCIIGFTVGSIFVLLPNFSSLIDVTIGALSCFLRFYCCFYVGESSANLKKTVNYDIIKLHNFIIWEDFIMTKNFFNKVRSFMKELGFSDADFEKFKESNSCGFAEFLSSCGAKRIPYRQNLRSIEGVGHSGLLITGGMSVITTTFPCGTKAVLIQHRELDEIGLPGGGTELWQYKNTVAEPFVLTAYREFKEEVGEDLHFELEFFEEHTSTIVYPSGDVTYSPCTFYRADVPYNVACHYAAGGSVEGKMALVKISDLRQYKIFSNHLAAFEKLEAEL